MRLDKLTSKLQSALSDAQSLALGKDNNQIDPVHLLLALIDQKAGSVRPLLGQIGFNVAELRNQLLRELENLPKISDNQGEISVTPELGKLLNQADKLAQDKGDSFISSETILLVAMNDKGKIGKILNNFGVSSEALENAILNLRGGENVTDANAEDSWQALQKYCVDLTERAENSQLDPVIGREDEITRVIKVLSRRTKNNPVLLGEPGVGKTAIIEGLAQSIVNGTTPDILADKRIISLDLPGMVAGTKYRGQFEERIKSVMAEVKAAKNVILFIDEIHTLVGAGGAEGAIDAANVLKPALSRG